MDEKRDRKRLAHLLTERSPEGELVLQRRSNGACVHLGGRGCTVYEQRPAVCRTFDCRVFAAMGLAECCGPNHRTPGWEFDGGRERDRRHGGSRGGWSAAIKPCAFGAPLRGCGA